MGKAYQSIARIQDHDRSSILPFSYLSIYLRSAARMLKKKIVWLDGENIMQPARSGGGAWRFEVKEAVRRTSKQATG